MDNEMTFISLAVTKEQKSVIASVASQEQRDISKLVRLALNEWAINNGYAPFFNSGVTSEYHMLRGEATE